MSTCALFIQGGGEGAHAEDKLLADSLGLILTIGESIPNGYHLSASVVLLGYGGNLVGAH